MVFFGQNLGIKYLVFPEFLGIRYMIQKFIISLDLVTLNQEMDVT